MNWPVIVDVRRGAAIAHCEHPACDHVHPLYGGMSVRDAEKAADHHLKQLPKEAL